MIVIQNVKITDKRIGYPYHQGRGPWIKQYNRFDIFKYCLASYAVLEPLVEQFHFYVTLESEFISRRDELESYMRELFPSSKLNVTWQRNDYTRDWRKTCNEILNDDNEVIWFSGNDDHIFIDYNLDMVSSAINTLKNDTDPYAVVYYSHWPEQVRMSHHLNGELTSDGNFIKFEWDNFDGIQIFKASRFKKYWFDNDYGDNLVFRPDDLYNHFKYSLPGTYYAPTREMVRHYDGYVHVSNEITDQAPCLFIPPDFFEKTMKIRIGFQDRLVDWTNFNPESINLFNTSPYGADYRWIEEDIPLFWRNHIKQIDKPDNYDSAKMYNARNAAFLKLTRIPLKCFGVEFPPDIHPPEAWFSKHYKGV